MRCAFHAVLLTALLCLPTAAQVLHYTVTEQANETILTSVTVSQADHTRIYDAGKLIPGTVTHYHSAGGVALACGAGTAALTPDSRPRLLDRRLTCALANPGKGSEPLRTTPVVSGAHTTPGLAITFAQPVTNRPGIDVLVFELHKGGRSGDPFHLAPLLFADGLKGVTIASYDIGPGHAGVREIGPTDLSTFLKEPRTLAEFLTTGTRQHSTGEDGFQALAVGVDLSQLGYAPGQMVPGLFLQTAAGKPAVDPAAILGLPAPVAENLLAAEPKPKSFKPEQTDLLALALSSASGAFDEIIFAQRVSGRDHWYGNFGHYCETESPYSRGALTVEDDMRYAFAPGGRLCRYNLHSGDLRILLLAPLAKSAGGLQLCEPPVFASTDDPDYQEILAAIRLAARELRETKRFDMPNFRPSRFYIREMQNYGLLPGDLGPDNRVDPYATDEAYWQTFTHRPRPDPKRGCRSH